MIKVTLDTCCIIHYLDKIPVDRFVQISRIFELHNEKTIEVAVTTRVINDKVRDSNMERRIRDLAFATKLKVVPCVLRWEVSFWDDGIGGDVMLSAEEGEEIDRIEAHLRDILVGVSYIDKTEEALERKFGNDFDHLIGHWLNRRDVFLTYDKDILQKTDMLLDKIGIKVQSPGGFLKEYPSLDGRGLRGG